MTRSIRRIPALGPMDDSWLPDPDGAELIENMTYGADKVWRTCGGFTEAYSGATSLNEVFSIHWFSQHNGGRQWVVFEEAGDSGDLVLRYIDFSGNTARTIESGRTLIHGPWVGTTYYDRGDWVYVVNGYDAPIRWNGREKVRVGYERRPAAPIVTAGDDSARLNDASGADFTATPNTYVTAWQRGIGQSSAANDLWVYAWGVTWVNDLGQESPVSALTWVRGTTDGSASPVYGFSSAWVQIAAAPSHVRGIRLWRSKNLAGTQLLGTEPPLYLVDEFSTGGEVNLIDDHPDSELGPLYDYNSSGLWPQRGVLLAEFKGTMFVSVDGLVRYSAPGFPEQMPEVNSIRIGGRSSGPITGMHATRNALVVFKRRGIYLIKGDPTGGFFAEPLTEDEGTEAPRSLVEVPGLGLMYLGISGPSVLVGALENTGTITGIQFLGDRVGRFWRDEYNGKAAAAVRATRNLRDREVWWQVPVSGDDRARVGLVYHTQAGGFSLRRDFPFSCLVETREHRRLVLAGSWDDSSNPGIHVYTPGTNLNGNTITSTYTSTWVDHANEVTLSSVTLHALNTGRALSVTWHSNWDTVFRGPADTVQTADPFRGPAAAKWGSAVLGTDSWQDVVMLPFKVDTDRAHGTTYQWRAVSSRMEISRADLLIYEATNSLPINQR